MRLAVVVSFLNEASYLPRLLDSIADQTDPPDELVLVDDGSTDDSYKLAQAFAAQHSYARALPRPARPAVRDRLVQAPELQAFTWGVEQLTQPFDVVAKLDGDLTLAQSLFADVRAAFAADPELGISGSILNVHRPEGVQAEHNPSYHVRGPNKFYRRACFEQISPLPAFLGWDTIDEIRARRMGWATRPLTPATGYTVHLRPTGSHDGRLRAYRRWGRCAWGYGAHPLMILMGTARRAKHRPYGLAAAHYLAGWVSAAVHRYPRAEPETVAWCRAEELQATRRRIARRPDSRAQRVLG
jgi:glycosyltransferase involved in cell wall biosynthesis